MAGPGNQSTSHLRKRRASSSQASEETETRPKKQRLSHPSFPPSRFWDNLSEIPLTHNALRELDRRNDLSISSSSRVSECAQTRVNRCTRRTAAQPKEQRLPSYQILDRCSPTSLKKIKRFSAQGGPDLGDLRGFPMPAPSKSGKSSSRSSLGIRKRALGGKKKKAAAAASSQSASKSSATPNTTPKTTTTKNTGPYDRAFQQHLIDHNILPDDFEYEDGRLPPEPDNLDEILGALAQPRASLSPSRFSNDDFRRFKRANTRATRESAVISGVIPTIEGDPEDKESTPSSGIPFTNLQHLTDGSLVPGNPDRWYGARPDKLNKGLRSVLEHQIVPSTQHDLPILPNFFLEVKGRGGTLEVASRQACYNGALGARAMHGLQSHGQAEEAYDNKAYTLTSLYNGGQLMMFTSHPIPPSTPERLPGFATMQVKAWSLIGDAESFRQGAAAYRNGRDWAKRQRDDAIYQANERASQDITSPQDDGLGSNLASDALASSTAVTDPKTLPNPDSEVVSTYESDTSADELSLDLPPAKRPTSQSRSS